MDTIQIGQTVKDASGYYHLTGVVIEIKLPRIRVEWQTGNTDKTVKKNKTVKTWLNITRLTIL